MANKYYSISTTVNTINEFEAALLDKYSTEVVIHYKDASSLIFSCARLCSKVIKINGTSNPIIYLGDAWTSGTSITNSIKYSGYGTSFGTYTYIHLVLGDYTMMLVSGTVSGACEHVVFGKLTNDRFAFISACSADNSAYWNSYLQKIISDNSDVSVLGPCIGHQSGSKIYKYPILLRRTEGSLELNTDGSFASFRDVYISSYQGLATYKKGSNYLFGPSGLSLVTPLGSANIARTYTSLLAEF